MVTVSNKKVLIMAGGTGGHVFPALAVAHALQKEGIAVIWLGTRQGMENQIVNAAHIPLRQIPITGWRGKGWKKWLSSPLALFRAVNAARKVIRSTQPNIVLGFGGFVSGPGGIAAKLEKIPLIIHEQNAIAGLTNKVLALFANVSLQAFPGSFTKTFIKPRCIIETIGNPIRTAILQLPPPAERKLGQKSRRIHLLVLGGSLGAQAINQIVPVAISTIPREERPQIWHQTGKMGYNETQKRYNMLGLKVKVEEFIEDMAQAYGWADIVICRAGATTVSELAAAGIGSILIPYPHAVDNHQMHNAKFLARAKASIILPQTDFSAARTAEVLHKLLKDRNRLLTMAEAAHNLRQLEATEKVVTKCLELMVQNKEATRS